MSPVSCPAPFSLLRAANRGGNVKLALADEYVWLVFYTTILFFFCFTCPIIAPFFSFYLAAKHLIDLHNWRRFYRSHHNQPELLTTAVKLLLLASLFPQLNTTLFLLARGKPARADGTFPSAVALLVANGLLLLLCCLSGWRVGPRPLFTYRAPPTEAAAAPPLYTDPVRLLCCSTHSAPGVPSGGADSGGGGGDPCGRGAARRPAGPGGQGPAGPAGPAGLHQGAFTVGCADCSTSHCTVTPRG